MENVDRLSEIAAELAAEQRALERRAREVRKDAKELREVAKAPLMLLLTQGAT